ncbi:MAG: protein kinase [Elusimicrobiota bacterium]
MSLRLSSVLFLTISGTIVCRCALAQTTPAPASEASADAVPPEAVEGGVAPVDSDTFGRFLLEIDKEQAENGGSSTRVMIKKVEDKLGLKPEQIGDCIEKLAKARPELFVVPGAAEKPAEAARGNAGGASRPAPRLPDSGPVALLNATNDAAVSENPRNADARARRGIDYQRQGQDRKAFDDLGAAISGGAASKEVLTAYGKSALDLGDFPLAASVAQAILKDNPGDYTALAIYHSAADRAPAVKLPSALGDLAQSRSAGEMPAGSAASRLSEVVPGGGTFAGPPPSGMTAEQAAELARQAAAPGSDATARSRQFTKDAASAMLVRDYPTAYQLASRAIGLNPQNAQALNYRAMTLSQMGRYGDAAQDASSALALAPGNAAVLHARSWAFSKEGKYKEGLQDAEAASASEPGNAFFFQDKALALAGLGDRAGAIEALRRSAALDPRFTGRLERAVQLPQDSDMTLLFDAGAAAASASPAPSSPGPRPGRFLRLAILSTVGGLLIALGVLHVVSASWRERTLTTVRRVLGSPASRPPAAAAVAAPGGSFWSQYEVIKEIGLGGMGVVYEATDRSLDRRVAVKKMRDEIRLDPDERRRFVTEARLVAALHHPGIVDIYGIVEDGMDVYLVFEFVEGRTLHDVLKSGGPLDLPRARFVVKQIADAVEHAHGRNIIHRDLKPSNVMLTPEGRVKVMDFGIARQAKDALTRRAMTNTIAGTPPYMAPEQEQGNVRRESDVFALGVCLYEMTTGFLPFTGSGAAMLLNKLNGKLIPACQRNPALPAGFDAVVARALAPDPDQRYRTPAELVAALDALLAPAA